jgi:membrane-bound lytic murein transglycosylase F
LRFPKLINHRRRIPASHVTVLVYTLLLFGLAFQGCEKTPESPAKKPATLKEILKSGELIVITRNNANCYYFYRDQEMGFEYDLAKAFAHFLGVRLAVKIAEKWDRMIPMLKNGKGHFIAAGFTITEQRQKKVLFSNGYLPVQQHIIVHRNNRKIKKVEDLAGKSIHVRRGTSYEERLKALKRRGLNIRIVLRDDIPTEELIRQVAEKEIEVTVADSNIALLNRRYYPHAIVAGPINEKEYLGWAVHPGAQKLAEQINTFFKTIRDNGEFAKIYNQYFEAIDTFDYVDFRAYHRRIKSRLPRYKTIIQKTAEKYGFDWRLIAAQIYQESHFNPAAKSHAGAVGLMQLTRNTAESLGVKKIYNPAENIRAGVNHLKNLYDYYDQATGQDRLYLALAAYNIGQGHVWDARRLAKRLNLDPNKWSSLAKTLPMLRFRKYNKNARYGYCRGTEPVKYVKQVMIYYDILRRQGIEYRSGTIH